MKKHVISTIFLSVFWCGLNAQNLSEEIKNLSKLNSDTLVKRTFEHANNNSNEIQLLLSGAFVFYKRNISSQDGSKCAFHQTCSEYALIAIKKQGLILGSINFFDRFTRCNTCSPTLYTIHPTSYKFDDQVR